jgi:hypothetical protein
MGTFTRIPEDTFSGLQLDAGILLKQFNPASPAVADADIICATTGGINPQCIPTYSDMGEDIDNCPVNMMEFKKLDGWDCKIPTTALGNDPDTIRLALGAADKAGNRVVPRRDLKQSDFSDLWWVGDRADGGFVAICLKNALSTGGFTLQTSKNGKGTITLELTGHVSVSAQNKVPMEFYSADPVEYTITNTLSHVTNSNTDTKAAQGHSYLAALTPDSGYTLGTATVTMGGTDITSTAYDDGIIVIDEVTGNIVITCSGTAVT